MCRVCARGAAAAFDRGRRDLQSQLSVSQTATVDVAGSFDERHTRRFLQKHSERTREVKRQPCEKSSKDLNYLKLHRYVNRSGSKNLKKYIETFGLFRAHNIHDLRTRARNIRGGNLRFRVSFCF